MLISVKEARRYARDNESSNAEMEALIAVAEAYIKAGVGRVDPKDPEAKMLCGLLVCEFNDQRTMSAAEANSTRLLVESLKLHLKVKAGMVSDSDTMPAERHGHDGERAGSEDSDTQPPRLGGRLEVVVGT